MEKEERATSIRPEGGAGEDAALRNAAGQTAAPQTNPGNAAAEPGADLDTHMADEDGTDSRAAGVPQGADLVAYLPPGIHVDGPIGEGLGTYSSIVYASPAESCTLETLMLGMACAGKLAVQEAGIRGKQAWGLPLLASVFVCTHKPEKLLQELRRKGASIAEPEPGVYDLDSGNLLRARIVVPQELERALSGYEWYRWMRDDLTVEDGIALLKRLGGATEEEKELGTMVADTALRGNPAMMKALAGDKTLDDELREVLNLLLDKLGNAE